MIETILSTLAEFGLIGEDYKHRKRIIKKEQEDGTKRPFQKYVMQPSVLGFIAIFIIVCSTAILFFTYQRTSIYPEKTKTEIAEMSERVENWNDKLGTYPTDMNELIGNSPIRQEWKNDAWDRAYTYTIMENGNGFLITSAGPDGQFGTEDDINSK